MVHGSGAVDLFGNAHFAAAVVAESAIGPSTFGALPSPVNFRRDKKRLGSDIHMCDTAQTMTFSLPYGYSSGNGKGEAVGVGWRVSILGPPSEEAVDPSSQLSLPRRTGARAPIGCRVSLSKMAK